MVFWAYFNYYIYISSGALRQGIGGNLSISHALTQWRDPIPNYISLLVLQEQVRQQYFTSNYLLGWKDADLYIRECNKTSALSCGLNTPDWLYGKTDYDVPCGSAQFADFYRDEDGLVLRGKKLTIIDVYCFATGDTLFLTRRIPVVNEAYQVIGSAFFATTFQQTGFDSIIQKVMRADGKKGGSLILSQENVLADAGKDATNREQRCMEIRWLLARGFTVKQIAEFYCLSPRTIEDYINEIKHAFCCKNKSQIIEKSICEGILNYLPSRLAFSNKITKAIGG